MNIYGPVDQARRVTVLWLKEQDRRMQKRDRERLAGLMARYFENEDQVTDQLMLSFLNHYIGRHEIDMEDPASVRHEIKTLLDKSVTDDISPKPGNGWPLIVMAGVGIIAVIAAAGFIGWQALNWPLSDAQQSALRKKVETMAAAQGHKTTSAIWARVKKPLDVRRYQDITYWQFDDAMRELDRIGAEGAAAP